MLDCFLWLDNGNNLDYKKLVEILKKLKILGDELTFLDLVNSTRMKIGLQSSHIH